MSFCVFDKSQVDKIVTILTPLEQELRPQLGDCLGGPEFLWISLVAQEALRQYSEQFKEGYPFNSLLCGLRRFGEQKNHTILELAQSLSEGLKERDLRMFFSSIFQDVGSFPRKRKAEDLVTKDVSEKDFSLLAKSFDPIFLDYITRCDVENTQFVERSVQRGASEEEIRTEMNLALIAQFLRKTASRP